MKGSVTRLWGLAWVQNRSAGKVLWTAPVSSSVAHSGPLAAVLQIGGSGQHDLAWHEENGAADTAELPELAWPEGSDTAYKAGTLELAWVAVRGAAAETASQV